MSFVTASPALLNGSGKATAWIFKMPKTGTLKKICFYTGTVTVADDLAFRIETVDTATGDPTGTLYDANATGSQALVNTDDNKGFWVPINGTTGISVTKDDLVAVKCTISYVDGNLNVVRTVTNYAYNAFPYVSDYLTGAWAKVYNGPPCISLEYDTGIVPIIGCLPAAYSTYTSVNSGSTPNYMGNRFQFPFSVRVVGFCFQLSSAAFYETEVKLYDSDGSTCLDTVTIDPDVRMNGMSVIGVFYFPTSHILLANTYYRIIVKPTTANLSYYPHFTVTDDGSYLGLDAAELGSNMHWTECTGAPANEASWTQITNKRMYISLIIDAIDIGGGSSASVMFL